MNIILILKLGLFIFVVKGFEYKYRPPITIFQCIHNDQYVALQIQDEMIFLQKLSILKEFMNQIKDIKIFLNILEQTKDFKEQVSIINNGLIEKFMSFKQEEMIKYDENEDPNDPQVVECYEKILQVETKLKLIRNYVYNSQNIYSNKFITQIQRLQEQLIDIEQQLQMFESYKDHDIKMEINQSQRDQNRCYGELDTQFQSLNQNKDKKINLQVSNKTKTKTNIKTKKKQSIKKIYNRNFLNEGSNFHPVELQLNSRWEYKQSKPISLNTCPDMKDKIEEDFLQFLKIQEIYKFNSYQEQQNQVINQLWNFIDEFVFNNKFILDHLKKVNIQFEYLINFKKYNFHNQAYDDVQKIYISYQQFQKELNIIYKQIQSTYDLSQILNKNLITEIKKQNEWIKTFLNTNFNYQSNDVLKELKQINRDYVICGGEDVEYGFNIKFTHGKTIQNNSEMVTDYYCHIMDIKLDILKDYKHLDLLMSQQIIGAYDKVMKKFKNFDADNYKLIYNLIKGLQLEFYPIKFKIYQNNYKPDDPLSVQAYQRLIEFNNQINSLKVNFNKAEQYIIFKKKNMQQIIQNYQIFQEIMKKLKNSKESEIQDHLYQLLQRYTQCTKKSFNEEYNIQKEEQLYNQNKINQSKQSQVHPTKTGKFKKARKNKYSFFQSSQIQLGWTYQEYPLILESECEKDLQGIREDILQFLKIQTLFFYRKNYQIQYNYLVAEILDIEQEFTKIAQLIKEDISQYGISGIIKIYRYPEDTSTEKKSYQNDYGAQSAYEILYQTYESLVYIKQEYHNIYDLIGFNQIDFSVIRYNHKLLNEYLDQEFDYDEKEVEQELQQLYRDYEKCTKISYENQSENLKQVYQNSVLFQKQLYQKNKQSTKHYKKQRQLLKNKRIQK